MCLLRLAGLATPKQPAELRAETETGCWNSRGGVYVYVYLECISCFFL